MHALFIVALIGILLLLEVLGLRMPFSILAGGLAFGVLLIGLPHGGLDQRIGLRLLDRFPRPFSVSVFFACYLLVAAVVIAGWVVAPLFTILAFFCLSAWHFGLEEETREGLYWVQRLGAVARGGMVIWIPAYFQGPRVTNLLSLILPTGDVSIAGQVVGVIQFFAPLLFGLLLLDTILTSGYQRRALSGLNKNSLSLLRIVAFSILFATVDPLISFGVYFCGWHSVLGLAHLRDQFQFSNAELALNLMPISLLAIALFAVGFVVSSSVNLVAPAIVQTLFIGLSAVAVPHLLLHVITDSLRLSLREVGP